MRDTYLINQVFVYYCPKYLYVFILQQIQNLVGRKTRFANDFFGKK